MRIRLIICISKEEKYSPKMEINNSFCLTFLFPKTFHLSIFVSWKLSPLHGSVQSLKHEHVFFYMDGGSWCGVQSDTLWSYTGSRQRKHSSYSNKHLQCMFSTNSILRTENKSFHHDVTVAKIFNYAYLYIS